MQQFKTIYSCFLGPEDIGCILARLYHSGFAGIHGITILGGHRLHRLPHSVQVPTGPMLKGNLLQDTGYCKGSLTTEFLHSL